MHSENINNWLGVFNYTEEFLQSCLNKGMYLTHPIGNLLKEACTEI